MSLFFKKVKKGLFMTHEEMWQRLTHAVASRQPDAIRETLEEVLIGADVGVDLTSRLLGGLDKQENSWESLRENLEKQIVSLFESLPPCPERNEKPWITLLVGVNGSGKTTTAAKLAAIEKREGRHPLLVAADTFRAGAIDQLRVWAERVNVPIAAHREGSDPAAVVYDALEKAKTDSIDSIIIDTAGRLHTKSPLMAQLAKIVRITTKAYPNAPHETYLVLDATTGQNGLVQAREFLNASSVSGIILTKLDGTARGGIILHIVNDLNLPVRYVGVGEGVEDLITFDPVDFTRAILTP